jgi:hypothetical protein
MKHAIVAVVAILAATAIGSSEGRADENWTDHLKITAQVHGNDLTVVLEGTDGWYVNTAFPGLQIGVNAPSGVGLDKNHLGKGDAKLEGTEHEGKAKRAVFHVGFKGSANRFDGSYKTVVCSMNSCSPPIKGTWSS